MNFASFGLDAELLRGLDDTGTQPTGLERAALRAALGGKDVAISAPRELRLRAWALPLLQRAREGRAVAVLAGDPEATRALAADLGTLAEPAGVAVAAICDENDAAPPGGVPIVAMTGWDRATGLPPNVLEVVVLHELEGLAPEDRDRLVATVNHLAGTGQALLAGTDGEALGELAAALGRRVVRVTPEPRRRSSRAAEAAADPIAAAPRTGEDGIASDADGAVAGEVNGTYNAAAGSALFLIDDDHKHLLLFELLTHEVPGRAVVFARTRYRADRVAEFLNRSGIPADRVHGNRSPGQRGEIITRFREGRLRIVVATDAVLRGGELPENAWRISFDVPEGADAFIQRQTGASAAALMFAAREESSQLAGVERAVGAFTRRDLPELDESFAEPIFTAPGGAGDRPPSAAAAPPAPRVPYEDRQPSFGPQPGNNAGGGKKKRRGRGGKPETGGSPGNQRPIQVHQGQALGGGRSSRAKRNDDMNRWDFEQPVLPEGSPYDLPERRPGERNRPSHVPAAFRRGGGST